MACRSTGWAMLASNSVQEVADLALVAQIATLESRIPFIHFFDGFRTSHEVGKILPISDETIRAMVDDKYLIAFRKNALTPDRPFIRGTAQNPDVFFQAREACTPVPRRGSRHRAVGDGPLCRADRPRLSPLRLLRRARCRARHHAHGFRRRSCRRSRGRAGAPGRKGRPAQGPPLSALRQQGLPGRAARDRQVDRRSRPLQGARRHRRAALSGHRDRAGRECRHTCPSPHAHASSAGATASRRRSSRRPWSRASSTS